MTIRGRLWSSSLWLCRVFPVSQPFQIEPRERQVLAGEARLISAAVETQNRAVLGDADVAVSAPSGLHGFVYRPRFAFVIADFHGDVFPVAIFSGRFLAVGPRQVVRIAKEDTILSRLGLQGEPDNASHADGFEKGVVEARCAP